MVIFTKKDTGSCWGRDLINRKQHYLEGQAANWHSFGHTMFSMLVCLFVLQLYSSYVFAQFDINEIYIQTEAHNFEDNDRYQSVMLSRGKPSCGAICSRCYDCIGIGIKESEVIICIAILTKIQPNCTSAVSMTTPVPFQVQKSVKYYANRRGKYDMMMMTMMMLIYKAPRKRFSRWNRSLRERTLQMMRTRSNMHVIIQCKPCSVFTLVIYVSLLNIFAMIKFLLDNTDCVYLYLIIVCRKSYFIICNLWNNDNDDDLGENNINNNKQKKSDNNNNNNSSSSSDTNNNKPDKASS